MPIRTLQSLIPDADDLVAREQPDIAYALMTCLLSLNQENLHFGNLMREGAFARGYPAESLAMVNSAASGAWSWLQGQGYLAQRPDSMSSDFMTITPQGRRWFDSRESVPKFAVGPSPLGPPTSLPEVGGKASIGRVSIDDLAHEMGVSSQQVVDILDELDPRRFVTESGFLESQRAEELRAILESRKLSRTRTNPVLQASGGPKPKRHLSDASKPGDATNAAQAKKQVADSAAKKDAGRTRVSKRPPEPFVVGTPGYTPEFCGLGGAEPVPDHLGVRFLANRLAELIISRETKLPLAIGLFGNWGSGKSHFMNLMDRRMRTPPETRPDPTLTDGTQILEDQWCKHVVPIYFNAWHYSDANLWASLVTQVFEALFNYLQPKTDELKLLQKRLQSAGGVTALALEEVRDASEGVRHASEELERARTESESALQAVRGFLDGLRTLIPEVNTPQNRKRVVELLGVEAEEATLTELEARLRDLSSIRGRIKELWRRAAAREGRAKRLGWLFGAVVVACLCRLGMSLLPQLQPLLTRIGPVIQTLLIALSGSIGWLIPAIGQVQKGLEQLENWQKRAENAQGSLRGNPQVAEAENEVIRADARKRAAEVALVKAQSQEAGLIRALNDLRPGRQLTRFIEARAHSIDYRGQLGLVSLARRDFEELSRIFVETGSTKDSAEPPLEQEKTIGQLGESIDRVVLFIDDLDRCEPERVVDVLQAVHLLLAYPLFAVVVGVDQRCLRQSLQLRFKGLLGSNQLNDSGSGESDTSAGEIPATPLDYLEKIFHIPFHLPPLAERGFANLVEKLTEPNAPPASPANVSESAKTATPQASSTRKEPAKEGPSDGPVRVIGSVPLHRWERNALKEYYSLIGTPRGVTRLLNTYRLVRAGIPEREWERFRADGTGEGESRLAMLLLAVAAGQPAIAREWFKLLRESENPNLPLDAEAAEANQPGWARFCRLYEEAKKQVKKPFTSELVATWIDRVELFTF